MKSLDGAVIAWVKYSFILKWLRKSLYKTVSDLKFLKCSSYDLAHYVSMSNSFQTLSIGNK